MKYSHSRIVEQLKFPSGKGENIIYVGIFIDLV